jgi:hypothetical protein
MDDELARWEDDGGFVLSYSQKESTVVVRCSSLSEVKDIIAKNTNNDTRCIGVVKNDPRRSETTGER